MLKGDIDFIKVINLRHFEKSKNFRMLFHPFIFRQVFSGRGPIMFLYVNFSLDLDSDYRQLWPIFY